MTHFCISFSLSHLGWRHMIWHFQSKPGYKFSLFIFWVSFYRENMYYHFLLWCGHCCAAFLFMLLKWGRRSLPYLNVHWTCSVARIIHLVAGTLCLLFLHLLIISRTKFSSNIFANIQTLFSYLCSVLFVSPQLWFLSEVHKQMHSLVYLVGDLEVHPVTAETVTKKKSE